MKNVWVFFLLVIHLIIPVCLQAQEEAIQELPTPDPLYVRVTIYPTANLSRYDYNNDVDLYEIRAYLELRDKNSSGTIIANARVIVH